jgi:hypothetical protein
MANAGKITIKSDVAAGVITVLTNACSSLENDVSSKLTSIANPLVELGFIDSSLTKIQTQISSIASLEKQMISSITSHMETVSNDEDELYREFTGGDRGGNYSGGNRNGSLEGAGDEIELEEEDGKKVNCEKLCEIIPELDEESKINLLKCLKFYKEEDTNFIDLLLDTSCSEELFTIIKKAFGDSIDIEELSLEDMQKVQRVLLDTILSKDVDTSKFEANSILIAKEYLIKICSDNEINPSNLFFDDKYRNTLKQTLKNIYNGDVSGTMSEEKITEFKTYIDNICFKNNTTAEELIDNKVEILL